MLSLPVRTSCRELRAIHKAQGEHLTNGHAVLVNAANNAKADRRALLDIADRHCAQP